MAATLEVPADGRTSIEKAIDLLVAFGERGHVGVGVSELARRARLSKSTAFRVLGLLNGCGIVERVGTGYRLGALLYDLGAQPNSPAYASMRDLLTPSLAELFLLTQETVHLAVLHGSDVLFLNRISGHHSVASPHRIGGRAPAQDTAAGRALLAFDSEAAEQSLTALATVPPQRTSVEPAQLEEQLARVRATGIAFDEGNADMGLSCVAMPVFAPGGQPVAALSVSAAAGKMDIRVLSAALRQVSHVAGLALARSGSYGRTRLRAS
jgi:DNA-binding IclR family transcriptional regulator